MQISDRFTTLYELSGVRDPRRAIRILANQLILESERTSPPFTPARYCELRNIEIRITDLQDCSARLLPKPDGYIAEISKNQHERRRNFSICHEVGHTFFMSNGAITQKTSVNCAVPESDDVKLEERLCDMAAAELLMPSKVFRAIASQIPLSLESVRKLGNIFLVSQQAIIHRIVELKLKHCIVTCTNPIVKDRIEVGFEINWWRTSAITCEKSFYSWNVISNLKHLLNTSDGPTSLGLVEALKNGASTNGQMFLSSHKRPLAIHSLRANRRVYSIIFDDSMDV